MAGTATLSIDDTAPGRPISPYIYGSNEIGVMDRGLPSAVLDVRAGIAARRLGGDLMTGYNWLNNASHAGKNHRHSNGAFLLEALQIPPGDWQRPAVIIEAMHEASLAMGARSLVTLPLAPVVAGDLLGPVAEAEAGTSRRFSAVDWTLQGGGMAGTSIPDLLRHLMRRYGDAASGRGIHAYALDNEPGIWFQTHPRLFPQRPTIAGFIARSVAVARVIKTLDPGAQVFGPASWGATEFVSFQDAPDWPAYRRYGTFLAAYLDAFRIASEQAGMRLLDALDVHWYAFHQKGGLFRSEDPQLDQARLDAPRSLTEQGFVEDSWVPRAFGHSRETLALPILPALQRLIARWFPGTGLAITEFNYGGAGQLTSGLALVDALGRFGVAGVDFATHWGSLPGWLGEAYRLFRLADAGGRRFGDRMLSAAGRLPAGVVAYAAADAAGPTLVLINKTSAPATLDIGLASHRIFSPGEALGFDAATPATGPVMGEEHPQAGGWRITLPPRAARRYAFSYA